MQAPMRGRPFVIYVAGLALALVLPAFIFSAVVAYHWVAAEKGRLETSLRSANEDAVVEIDRYLVGLIAMLQALATSPAIDQRDFTRLDRQARELGNLQKVNIALRDRTGQTLVNTRYALGAALPKIDLATDRRVEKTKLADVTDQIQGASSGRRIVLVNVPVMRGDEVVYFISALLTRDMLGELIRDTAAMSVDVSLSIVDRSGTILATTGRHGHSIEGRLPGLLPAGQSHGQWEGTTADGAALVTSLARSAISGWTVAASIEKAVMEAALHRSEWLLAGLSLLLTALALSAALLAMRKMMQAHHDVAEAAKFLGYGLPFQAPVTAVREVNLIGTEIAAAAVRLRQQAGALATANNELEQRVEERTKELEKKTELLEVTLDNMDQGLMMVDSDGRIAVCNRRAVQLMDLPPEIISGRLNFAQLRGDRLERDELIGEQASEDWGHNLWNHPALQAYERERSDGTTIEIRTVPLAAGGAVRTFTDVTARKSSESQARHMARHDPLTDLANRTLFRERLGQHLAEIRRYGGVVAVLSLDLDRFKIVNDTMGHPAGDALLREVANRIRAVLRTEDTVARLGGDEFAIIQVGASQPMAARKLSERLIDTICKPVLIDGRSVTVGASIGIAVTSKDDLDPDHILKKSDLALYRAKSEGRGTFRFYEPGMVAATDACQRLNDDLAAALARQEFGLDFQPMLDVGTGAVCGFEALLRWHHPDRGCVAPLDCLAAAEAAGLAGPIGEWVLHEACRQAASWGGERRVAVNVSAAHFADGALVRHVLSALSASGLPAAQLELDVSETVLMNDDEAILQALHHLRGLGVRIALDDFGASPSRTDLRKFPFDKIKVDGSVVCDIADPATASIVRSLAALSSRLGAVIAAEGVETREQFDLMRAHGCGEMQGFFISRPLPAHDAMRLLSMTDSHDREAA